MASRVGVDPKDITLIGSARLGHSLFSDPLGKPFSEKSDRDLSIVSIALFEQLASEFNSWAFSYESGAAAPSNESERFFWNDNLARAADIIGRGFIDSKVVPRREPFVHARQVGQAMYLLTEKLRITPGGPVVKHASIRAYRNWDAFVQQIGRSLSAVKIGAA